MYTRRSFVALGAAAGLTACAAPEPVTRQQPVETPPPPPAPPMPDIYDAVTDEPFPVPAVPRGVVPQRYWRQSVANPYPDEPAGSIVVDPDDGFLHLIEEDGQALRYGAGTGRMAFSWSGVARVQFTREWPRWKVPEEMIVRQPELAPYSVANGGMPGGPDNPLGARALYLFEDGVDTLYRIHGGCEPQYVGQAVSSGCIRLLDQDAIHLAGIVPHGARVKVLPSMRRARTEGVY